MRNFLWTAAQVATSAMVVAFVVSGGPAFAENSGTDGGRAREWRAIEWSLRLVALDRGIRVTLIDPDLAPDPDAIARLDAFIVRNAGGDLRPVITSIDARRSCRGPPREKRARSRNWQPSFTMKRGIWPAIPNATRSVPNDSSFSRSPAATRHTTRVGDRRRALRALGDVTKCRCEPDTRSDFSRVRFCRRRIHADIRH